MIKFKEKTLLILDDNGDTVPFQIEELQSELAECFCKGNQVNERDFAEDIILSLDYFFNENNSGNLYSIQEVNQMVANILDEAGFFDIAEIYRKKKNFLEPLYSVTADSLIALLSTKTFFPATNLSKVAQKTAEMFGACGVKEATLSLIIEMAKFVNISLSTVNNDSKEKEKPVRYGYYLKESAIREFLNQHIATFAANSAIRIGGVSKIHSAIKIYINLLDYEVFKNAENTFMELELAEILYDLGRQIDEICKLIVEKCSEVDELKGVRLPIYLNLIDMRGFAVKCMGVDSPELGKKFIKDIVSMITDSMANPVYKVIFKEKSPFLEKK